ncbi:MAG TPA: hypothetical protein DCL21_01725 [Alphaproteobacteria bacterium]|nr:hypothetical protein [Alphaproteobacteria bacterium]
MKKFIIAALLTLVSSSVFAGSRLVPRDGAELTLGNTGPEMTVTVTSKTEVTVVINGVQQIPMLLKPTNTLTVKGDKIEIHTKKL